MITKILYHLGLYHTSQRPPPKPKSLEIQIDYSDSQLTFYEEAFDKDFGASSDHSPGYFFDNDQGNPTAGIRKNFLTGQTWNPHMMADPYLDKTWQDALENPKLTEKQAMETMKKLAVYALDQAPAIVLPTSYYYLGWWPWVNNYQGELFVGALRGGPIMARLWIDQEMKKKMGF